MNVECKSAFEASAGDYLLAHEILEWLEGVPPGAVISAIIKDFGSQRDPAPTLVGLRAKWSETR
jgi:hypothetical protein